ncbi:sensor histidine kinase [Butyrivibrio sp. MC2021]|uniref:sensor histidine kinase n=1 Tax=Butyrivibrio sp. MC2021 TaxID=1408306 RepID=UPI00047D6728|nr:HAMP domain-containing sensor histidine kinase [Butyrivibrio sp. MC2021]
MGNFFTRNIRAIRLIQHILAAVTAVLFILVLTGSDIIISGVKGDYSYNLYESDKNRSYEDSYLFNNILGNNLSDVIRLAAQKSQLETRGEYDGEKKLDVTAYVNRNSVLFGDYLTAVYKVSDLLKWAQAGFTYETRSFTQEESAAFLSSSTTYTHLKNNMASGGMNSYLSSQIENNSVAFSVTGNTDNSGGDHTVLLQRYQTANGKNIENLVAGWDEYNLLCSYVEEASKELQKNYKEYEELSSYYSYENSNLRYFIIRTVNGKNEIFTNIDNLRTETAGVDVMGLFESYGKYIYYCPYELDYETNTLIKEDVLREIIKKYGYAFPDQIKVYIAVDTNQYTVLDSIAQGKRGFSKYMPYKRQMLILIGIAAVLYLFCLYFNLRNISSENKTEGEHSLFTEGIILMGGVVIAIPIVTLLAYSYISGNGIGKLVKLSFFPFVAAGMAFVMDIGLLFIVYTLASKAKAGRLWEDSFMNFIGLAMKDVIVKTTDNGNIIIRTWVPYLTFVVLNILLINLGISGIVIAAILDILVGIYLYRQNLDRDRIIHVIENIQNGDSKAKVNIHEFHTDNINLARAVNSISEGISLAVNTSMKDEKLKADLITNVSHDIKTPLTSIINYVDLLKREDIENEKVKEYLDVLEVKSYKLKQLTEDLVEVSKISSGNINITLSKINFVELMNQTVGEFYEKFEKHGLKPVVHSHEPQMEIMADPRHLWRVIENLINNVCKYALAGTRVFLGIGYQDDAETGKRLVVFSIKNISANELSLDETELTERFIRGDVSRTTEGSGLGLSIAKSLTEIQGGVFDIRIDGDLFTVFLKFDAADADPEE